jgi:oleate hydratase
MFANADVQGGRMKAHIVGGGFGGLAAAALLIRNTGVPGEDITIYEADDRMGGGFFLAGDARSGYNLPDAYVFDKEFRCAFDLLASIPSVSDPNISVKDQFFAFNAMHLYPYPLHIIDRNGHVAQHSWNFGLSLSDRFALARLSLTPEAWLDARRIEEFFSPRFFSTEFWLLFTAIAGALPQHCAMEFRRYLNRNVGLLRSLSDTSNILRTPINPYQTFIEPLVAWLRPRGVNLLTGAFVQDIGFAPLPGRITVNRLDYERGGAASSVAIAPEDIVLVTIGSQAADFSTGSMAEAPEYVHTGRSWALWKRLAQGRKEFGNPNAYFGAPRIADSRWVTFTVTTTGTEFIDQIAKLTGDEPERLGRLILIDSSWVLALSIRHQPKIIDQPRDTLVWSGYGLYPERNGDFIRKRMDQCTGAEILEEVLRQLRFDRQLDANMASSICIPCDMPYVNNVWLMRKRGHRPPVVPDGATNIGLIGQYVEAQQEIAFTIEYSARTAWQAVHTLLQCGPAPPPVYQKAALLALVGLEQARPYSPATTPPRAPAPAERERPLGFPGPVRPHPPTEPGPTRPSDTAATESPSAPHLGEVKDRDVERHVRIAFEDIEDRRRLGPSEGMVADRSYRFFVDLGLTQDSRLVGEAGKI